MSGNNMSRPVEEYEYSEEEIYEDVYEYAEEEYLRKLINHLGTTRNMAIDLAAYPDTHTKTDEQDDTNGMRVYIKSENLSFIRNQKHVYFNQFGEPFIRKNTSLLPNLFDYSSDDEYMNASIEEIEEEEQWQRDYREGRRELCENW